MKEIKAKIMSIYGEYKEIGQIRVADNKMTITMENKRFRKDMLAGPYDPDTEGEKAYEFLCGRFARSSTTEIAEEKDKK